MNRAWNPKNPRSISSKMVSGQKRQTGISADGIYESMITGFIIRQQPFPLKMIADRLQQPEKINSPATSGVNADRWNRSLFLQHHYQQKSLFPCQALFSGYLFVKVIRQEFRAIFAKQELIFTTETADINIDITGIQPAEIELFSCGARQIGRSIHAAQGSVIRVDGKIDIIFQVLRNMVIKPLQFLVGLLQRNGPHIHHPGHALALQAKEAVPPMEHAEKITVNPDRLFLQMLPNLLETCFQFRIRLNLKGHSLLFLQRLPEIILRGLIRPQT